VNPVQRFYRRQAFLYDATRWPFLHGRRRAVERLHVRPDGRVLEIGCGTGLNFRHILSHLDPARGRLTAIDFSPEMLARARRRARRRGWGNVELLQADATQLDLGRAFDGVLLAYSLTMIPDWREALRRAFAHLEPGGRLVVLDFSDFRGWGPLGTIMRRYLRFTHVEAAASYIEGMGSMFRRVHAEHWCGRYSFIAAVTKDARANG
jgi:ubiquinone/menaquinone biosynthesis C-methylase UbiE